MIIILFNFVRTYCKTECV